MKKIQLSEGVYTVELERADEPIAWDARFKNPTDLCELYVPDGAQIIAEHAFSYCENLMKLHLPESIIHLGDKMFYATYHAIEIFYSGSSEQFKTIGAPRKVKKQVQVSGKYDHQPYNSGVGSYYEERLESEWFVASFSHKCIVHCSDGITLTY